MNQTDKENLHKEIDLIQECIKRMASNSFMLKGWAISLVAVVLALSEKNVSPYFLGLVVLVPLISFWYLDAFFLYTEKLYRKMYEWVIAERVKSNNDNMYDLNPHRFKKDLKVRKWNKTSQQMEDTDKIENVGTVMRSVTLICFYLIPTFLVILILIVLFVNQQCKVPSHDTAVPAVKQPAVKATQESTGGTSTLPLTNQKPKAEVQLTAKETTVSNEQPEKPLPEPPAAKK